MKKKIVCLLLSLLVVFSFIYAEDEYSYTVEKEYHGTYLPLSFIDCFDKTLNFEKAKKEVDRDCHDVLALREDGCLSSVRYHDGYKIEKDEFLKYKTKYSGEDLFLTDDKGYKYKRICLGTSLYKEVTRYLTNKMFSCINDLKNVKVLGNQIFIEGVGYYEIELDSNFFKTRDCLALLIGRSAIKTNGMSGGIYKVAQRGNYMEFDVTDEEIVHFPLFSYTPLLPLEEMSVSELRLYRNLQFARHGYKFKSKDLTEIFSQFEWYEAKKNNDGIKLTKEEEEIVNTCLKIEQEKKKESEKNKVLSLPVEEKEKFMEGVWLTSNPSSKESFGYVFFDNKSFEYKDTVTKLAKEYNFVSCKGEWDIIDNDIWIKVSSYRSIKSFSKEKGWGYAEITPSDAGRYKIGNLETFSLSDNGEKKGELCPLILTSPMKNKKEAFYYQKEGSDISENDFYNATIEDEEKKNRIKFAEYLKEFFGEKEYSVSVQTCYTSPIFIAQSFIEGDKTFCDKAVVYLLEDGFIDVLLSIDKNEVKNKSGHIFADTDLSIDSWKIEVSCNSDTNSPCVYLFPRKDGKLLEQRYLVLNKKEGFCLKDENKKKEVNNYNLTEDVVYLPSGTDGSNGIDGEYFLFGDYPQSLKEKDVKIDKTKTYDINGWQSYKGSDGCFYVQHEKDNNYYKIESIKWCCLDSSYQGGKLLVSEKCLDNSIYFTEYTKSRKIDGKAVGYYNYEYSTIRAYLNALDGREYGVENFQGRGFIDRAFTKDAKERIQEAQLDFQEGGRGRDKVFLLSFDEITDEENMNYNTEEDPSKVRMMSSYCNVLGTEHNDKVHGCYWLRSARLEYGGPKVSLPHQVNVDGRITSWFLTTYNVQVLPCIIIP